MTAINLNGKEIWIGDWWKAWKRVLEIVSDNRDKIIIIDINTNTHDRGSL